MKDPLGKFVIAVTGNFNDSNEKIKGWVQANGGKWAATITKHTTHLICSEEHWKRDVQLVAAAKAYPNIHVVKYDWLEDSLQARRPKSEKPYLWKTIMRAKLKEQNRKRAEMRRALKQDAAAHRQGCNQALKDLNSGTSKRKAKNSNTWFTSSLASLEAARSDRAAYKAAAATLPTPSPDSQHSPHPNAQPSSTTPSPPAPTPTPPTAQPPPAPSRAAAKADNGVAMRFLDLYHFHRDRTNFIYDIVLARIDLATNTNSRYLLRLYETNTLPHAYCTVLRYITPNMPAGPAKQYVAPMGSSFEVAFRAWRSVFQQKTLLAWEERLLEEGERAERVRARMKKGDCPFFYRAPMVGLARGVFPGEELRGEVGGKGVRLEI
ncbi:hypothetical protein BU16DRAFT_554377 [Lophium mytilinum]|uniref:Uncharacterized protein n=1 Tax=Lophium mytilinum TaxID=390894 RepID=A0A6A6RCN1_9PEZI|nr:hypothetical protein BU16DRAFT_554377 [Lophium mytilinum]